MRKYILVVVIFMLTGCTLGQRNAKQNKSEPPAPISASIATTVPTAVPPTQPSSLATVPPAQPTNALIATRVPLNAIPAIRLALLARGVNLTQWYKVTSPTPFSNYYSDNDLKTIRALGFTDIRLAVPLSILFQPDQPAVPNPQQLAYLDDAITQILSNGLAVIVDMHAADGATAAIKNEIETNATVANGYVAFWSALAQHLNQYDPDMVFLEILNEPDYSNDPEQWIELQNRLVAAIRAKAPASTIVATGPVTPINGLIKLTPVADPNVIYTFHFYEPFTFTAQGKADVPDLAPLKDLPYPWSSTRCDAAVAALTNADAKKTAQQYCKEQWDAAKLDADVQQAANWAHQNNAHVFVGEFGADSRSEVPSDRVQWFEDVYNIWQKYQIPWTLWGYDDTHGLDRQVTPQGNISLDMSVVNALQLNAASLK
ncbi:MAG: cellulase family glycosylhydrolase [Anaerolineales bacterium]